MPRYLCTSCAHEFELQEEKPRCPRCLRTHGIEPVAHPAAARPRASRSSRRLLIGTAVLALLVAGAAAAWVLLSRRAPPAERKLAITAPPELARALAAQGVPAADRVQPFSTDDALRALARRATGSTPGERASAVARELGRELGQARVVVDLRAEGEEETLGAAELLAALRTGKRRAATSLELAALAVAALRALEVPALLGEARRLKAPVATPDISGGAGRYLALVYASRAELGRRAVLVLDPSRAAELPSWAGGGDDPALTSRHDSFVPLDDLSVAAHFLALRALRLRGKDPPRAYRLSALAVKLASPSALLLLSRARVLAAAGAQQDVTAAAQQAVAAQDSAAARVLLAQALVAEGRIAEAPGHLEEALRLDGSYFPAHAALATLRLPLDRERGLKHLRAGLGVAPDDGPLLILEATVLLGEDKAAEAAQRLERVVARSPSEAARVLLYQALRRAGDSARATTVREALIAGARDRARTQKLLDEIDEMLRVPEAPPAAGLPEKLKLPDVTLKR